MVRQSRLRELCMAIGVLLALMNSAFADVKMNPIRLTLNERQPVGTLTMTNAGETPKTFQVRMYDWSQPDGNDSLEPTRKLWVTPAVYTLEPGATQRVRVALRQSELDEKELAYRAFFKEVPTRDDDNAPMALKFALEISVPVFVTPRDSTPGRLSWQAYREPGTDKLYLHATNEGDRHIKLTEVDVDGPEEQQLVTPSTRMTYILPGAERVWQFSLLEPVAPSQTLKVRALSGRETVNASVLLESARP